VQASRGVKSDKASVKFGLAGLGVAYEVIHADAMLAIAVRGRVQHPKGCNVRGGGID
jgi:hypothetical protein